MGRVKGEPARSGMRVQGLALAAVSAGFAALSGLIASGLISARRLSNPAGPGAAGFSLCGFRALTGLPCPFCGGVRASASLFEGALAEALSWNPAAVLGHGALWLTGIILVLGKTPVWLEPGRQKQTIGAAAVVLVANWIYLIAVGR